jgi:hypothetical protein
MVAQRVSSTRSTPYSSVLVAALARHVEEEYLDWMLIWGLRHLERILDEYVRPLGPGRPRATASTGR